MTEQPSKQSPCFEVFRGLASADSDHRMLVDNSIVNLHEEGLLSQL